ncbi:MAG TPA: proline dehydrogenase family protein [Longimicrobiaceae bacterium]|nr:proline dehydrogenase family protein [Longimicrobiaceae bacterium]
MFREGVLYLSNSPRMRRLVTETGFSKQLAQRFVAGDTLDDAIAAAKAINASGLTVSLDYLGESVTNRAEATAAAEMAVASLVRLSGEGIVGNISLKPTQLGLELDRDFCLANVEGILARARELGDGEGEIFVRLDMESSEYTEGTIELVEALWSRGYRNVGTVVQSYLYRTISDVRRLNALGSRVRLVKGAYQEPAAVAYQDKEDVDRQFVLALKLLLKEGIYPAIATHDDEMVAEARTFAFEHGIARDSFEFQMLYGIRRDLQQRLREEGYNVRVYLPYGDSWYPYLMRRMAERPANLFFLAGSVMKESPAGRLGRPKALGAGLAAGVLAALAFRSRNSK